MKTLFTDQEIRIIDLFYEMNFSQFIDDVIKFEELESRLIQFNEQKDYKDYESVLGVLVQTRNRNKKLTDLLKKPIKKAKEENFDTVSSLEYYIKFEHNTFSKLKDKYEEYNSTNIAHKDNEFRKKKTILSENDLIALLNTPNRGFEKSKKSNIRSGFTYLGILRLAIASIFNLFFETVEKTMYSDGRRKQKILLFECNPIDLDKISSGSEVRDIRLCILNNSKTCFPIIRYGTNKNCFEKTCKIGYVVGIHFAGHGETDGSLYFMNSEGKSCIYSTETFLDFIKNDFTQFNNSNLIWSFFNSCHSDTIARRFANVSHFQNPPLLVLYTIGHIGENIDKYANEFAKDFYNDLMPLANISSSVVNSFTTIKGSFERSSEKAKSDYARNKTIYLAD